MYFVHDRLMTERQLKCLMIVDHCTREAPVFHADHSISGRKPAIPVPDNGSEFRSKVLAKWASDNGVLLHFIEPGNPTQNAYCESFNGRFCEECMNQNLFANVSEARLIIEAW